MLDVLSRWNRWGTAALDSGRRRAALGSLLPFLETRDVVTLVGPRRAGKTTLLFQAMDELEARGTPRESCLHVNLEEPALQPSLGLDLLDRLYRTFREEVYPKGRAFVFLDEVQGVPGWERWVRARTETDDLKVFVTGSTSRLLSRELGTLLTGRHVEVRVWPLDFAEFLEFRGIAPPRPGLVTPPPPVARALTEYLRWGGFPEVVLSDDTTRKEHLLRQYLDDVLFKDVALRHEVRDLSTLRTVAVHLLTSTASLMSFQRLSSLLGISLDQARSYCAHLEEAFIVRFAQAFSLKVAERRRNPQKVHAIDTGLRNIVALSASSDTGRVAESAVFESVARRATEPLHYWRGRGEVDVLVRSGTSTTRLIQVAWDVDGDAMDREIASLEEAGVTYPAARRELVVARLGDRIDRARATRTRPAAVGITPLWRFLLDGASARPAERRATRRHTPTGSRARGN